MNREQPQTRSPSLTHLVMVRAEPEGQYTAEAVGLPEIRATAATRAEAVQQVRQVLVEWLQSGQLVQVEVFQGNSWPQQFQHTDPNDPLEKEFLEDLARFRQEDLERTLKEYEQGCSPMSSTPTT
jgi:hypothetical protein